MDAKLQDKLTDRGYEAIASLCPAKTQPPPRKTLFWISPINVRRWNNFKANRRGFWSLWIFLLLFFISLFAEFIANDEPFLVKYKGEVLQPLFSRPITRPLSAANSTPRQTIAIRP